MQHGTEKQNESSIQLNIKVPISVGELLDKISILQIKSKYGENKYITKELKELIQIAKENKVYDEKSIQKLFIINKKLWDIEDLLRQFEKENEFGNEFIKISRLVYRYNDERFLIKKSINEIYNSTYREIKFYV